MKSLLPLCLAAMLMPAAQAGQIDISFENVQKYTDIDSGRESQKRYTERVLRRIGEFFGDVAAKLPEDNTLHIVINNIDLAGDTRFGSGHLWDVRLMTDLYSPWMTFDAKVLDDKGTVRYEASEKIRDFNYLSRGHQTNREFEYEKHMINRWGRDLLNKLN
ncbi:MAG TPA: DUF3016 domain-containing protein [Pseudomonadales bacterium]|nr:DUF3016 domain-containing protein [Pseudomonadales bacterium]